MGIKASNKAYEDWLRDQLGHEVVEKDLEEKLEKMASSAFTFLRATYWRWSQTILAVCPALQPLPQILSIGDTHLENFGTWRDAEGRLVWGANDFDDAAVMPYALDLVRLAASVLLAEGEGRRAENPCGAILEGYRAGLDAPGPVVLERDRRWLREALLMPETERAKWWAKFDRADERVPNRFRSALAGAMPAPCSKGAVFARSAGVGSLGKPRFVARAQWCGGPVLRECKAILPSVWPIFGAKPAQPIRAGEIAAGPARAPDPHYRVSNGLVVRRLSPNSRKIEAEEGADVLLSGDMLALMGREIASCHAGDLAATAAVKADLDKRHGGWLAEHAKAAARAVEEDHRDFVR